MTTPEPPSLQEVSAGVRELTELRGIGLAVFGGIIVLVGQTLGSRMTTLVGFGFFIPGLLQFALNFSENVASATKGQGGINGAILQTLAISIIGFLLITQTNFSVNLLLFTGFTLIASSILSQRTERPPPRVEFRFVNRTFKEEQSSPVKPSEIFQDLFQQANVFPLSGYASNDANFIGRRSLEQIQSPFS